MKNWNQSNAACASILLRVTKRVETNARGPERRAGIDRRSGTDRRFGERRDPARAAANRRVLFPFDRRIAERRFLERRSEWPEAQAY
jgi:hypothetical protein